MKQILRAIIIQFIKQLLLMDFLTIIDALLLKFWMTSWVKAKNYPRQTHHLLIKVNNQPSARFSRLFASSTSAMMKCEWIVIWQKRMHEMSLIFPLLLIAFFSINIQCQRVFMSTNTTHMCSSIDVTKCWLIIISLICGVLKRKSYTTNQLMSSQYLRKTNRYFISDAS